MQFAASMTILSSKRADISRSNSRIRSPKSIIAIAGGLSTSVGRHRDPQRLHLDAICSFGRRLRPDADRQESAIIRSSQPPRGSDALIVAKANEARVPKGAMRRRFLISNFDDAAHQLVSFLPELLTLLSTKTAAHSQQLAA